MTSRWTNEFLNDLRHIGDPETDLDTENKDDRETRQFRPAKDDLGDGDRRSSSWVSEYLPVQWDEDGKPYRKLNKYGKPDVNLEQREYWRTAVGWETRLDRAKVHQAQDLFVRFGQEIGVALLAASLPEAYAAESGARVLTSGEALLRSTNPDALSRRIGRTAQFLLDVMLEDKDPVDEKLRIRLAAPGYARDPRLNLLPYGPGYVAARSTRRVHSHIRLSLGDWKENESTSSGLTLGKPINQEHLIGTYLSFSVTVWSSLERLGVRWTPDERESFLHVWDWVAQLMGIGTPGVKAALFQRWDGPEVSAEVAAAKKKQFERDFGDGPIRPRTVAEAEELSVLIHDRNWPATEEVNAFQNSSGKQLMRALLDELEGAMPGGMQAVPLEVVRYLVDPRVSVALGLGGGGLPPVILGWVQGQSRGWNKRKANPAVAPVMRWAANQVSLHSFVSFMKRDGEDQLRFGEFEKMALSPRRGSGRRG